MSSVYQISGKEPTYKISSSGRIPNVFSSSKYIQSTSIADHFLLNLRLSIVVFLALSGPVMGQFGSVGQPGSSVFFHSSKPSVTLLGNIAE